MTERLSNAEAGLQLHSGCPVTPALPLRGYCPFLPRKDCGSLAENLVTTDAPVHFWTPSSPELTLD